MEETRQLSVPGSLATVPATPGFLRRGQRALLDALFPPRCVACRQTGSVFCPACLGRVQPVDEPPRGATDAAGCTHLSGIRSAGVYKPPLSLAIRRFKYRGRTDLAASLGRLMAQAWQSNPRPIDFVAPIPLHEKRLAERGYNQAALLAAELCRAAHLPLVAPGLLTRQKDTEHQVQLGLEERQRNVKDAFVWIGPPLTGATVLLIDDVATTGSTLEACAEALIHAGAGSVHALTVARAVLKDGARAAAADGSRRTKEG